MQIQFYRDWTGEDVRPRAEIIHFWRCCWCQFKSIFSLNGNERKGSYCSRFLLYEHSASVFSSILFVYFSPLLLCLFSAIFTSHVLPQKRTEEDAKVFLGVLLNDFFCLATFSLHPRGRRDVSMICTQVSSLLYKYF